MQPFSRDQMARRAADDIPEGWCVNLGIGIPTMVANHVPQEREVIFQSENGVIGMGPAPAKGEEDPWLINAGKQPITLVKGASFVGHADSFATIRGGHIDLCVLGGFEVAENGDLANWATSENDTAPAVGGAMDLAAGARRLWVLMEHTTKDGRPKLVERCGYPLTGLACVNRVYTNLAVLDVVPGQGFVVREMAPGLDFETLQAKSGAKLHRPS
jgi:3-oxoadipate CoA-transferase beta subunit